jgi:hypothetical protein
MKVVELSDHPGGMLDEIHSRRRAEAGKAQARYQAALARHEQQARAAREQAQARHEKALARHGAYVRALRRRQDQARAGHRWLAWLRASALIWYAQRRRPRPSAPRQIPQPPAPLAPGQATDQEEILAAGITGERIVAAELGAALGDEWVLLHGYRNHRGEIDHVLLGPRGMITIEVKHHNATVDIDGDKWWSRKYDRWGNLHEQGWIADRRGRSPSVQLNEPTAELEKFVRRRSQGHQPVRVRRVVILTHPRSALGTCRNLTIDLATTATGRLLSLLDESPPVFDAVRVAEIYRLVVRDHRFNQRRLPP